MNKKGRKEERISGKILWPLVHFNMSKNGKEDRMNKRKDESIDGNSGNAGRKKERISGKILWFLRCSLVHVWK